MSESNLISPLLDGFALGTPMSDHNGVQCCPAIKENTDNKYIVKIISVPASQVQMDALLLTGAYKDPADAMDYFKQQAEDIVKEAEFLQKLSKLEGFLPYEIWQIEPITRRRLGYYVYLVSSYKRSLEKYSRRNPVTHLQAVNLGLDLCAALAACRRAGSLYIDLKPSNVFISEDKEYRIGDLGFVALDSLKYMSLPEKYRSVYSPPELHDPMSTLNETADTYALGMILYQLYNDGQLPFRDHAPETELPTPINADYEIAEIILKAIHPDPAQRWEDPTQMGQALVAYMQRNTVNDVPIAPNVPIVADPADVINPEEAGNDAATGEAMEPTEAPVQDETLPTEETAPVLQEYEMSEEMTEIVDKADTLISHEMPPEIVIKTTEDNLDLFDFINDDADAIQEEPIPQPKKPEQQPEKKSSGKLKKFFKRTAGLIVLLVFLAGLAVGGYWVYQNLYLQPIHSMKIEGNQHQLVVTVDTPVDQTQLTVTCTDSYGNSMTAPLENGQAVFTDLLPDSLYKIQLEIDGFHRLTGPTSDIFTTEGITTIVSLSAITGPEDGSVMLNFTASGSEPEEWIVTYVAQGQPELHEVFTGHTVTIKNLAVGKTYTFTLEPNADLEMDGENSLEFTASRLVLAEELSVVASGGTDMTVRWKAPGDVIVESWDVRCYSETGYEEQLTVTDTEVLLTGIDPTVGYTVEVTAAGMTQAARTSITANPITVTNIQVDESSLDQLTLRWDYSGAAPEGGWLVMYSIDGSQTPSVIKSDEPSAVIAPRIPSAKYEFVIQSADGTSIFSNIHTYSCPNAQIYSNHGLSAENISAHLLKTPADENWNFGSVGEAAFADTFASGTPLSLVLHGKSDFYVESEPLEILYVFRDGHGNVLPEMVTDAEDDWRELWIADNYHYGELDLPRVPTEPGSYSLSVYFNNYAITVIKFTIT